MRRADVIGAIALAVLAGGLVLGVPRTGRDDPFTPQFRDRGWPFVYWRETLAESDVPSTVSTAYSVGVLAIDIFVLGLIGCAVAIGIAAIGSRRPGGPCDDD